MHFIIKKICKIFFILILLIYFRINYSFCDSYKDFKKKTMSLRWIAYAPTNFNPVKKIYPSEESIREDLLQLFRYGFRGIVTYGSKGSLSKVPAIASRVGFQAVIMGIWDINDREEIMEATLASNYVDGYCVGNEGLNIRYSLDSLNKAILNIKETTQKFATTAE